MICSNKREFEEVTQGMVDRLNCDSSYSFNINAGDIITRGDDIEAGEKFLSCKTKNCVKVISYEDIKEIWVRADKEEEDNGHKIGFDLS